MRLLKASLSEFFKNYLPEFRRHFWRYVSLFWGTSLFLQYLLLPIFSWLAGLILGAAAIPYLSYDNLMSIMLKQPLVFLLLLLLLRLLLIVLFFQFVFFFLGTRMIRQGDFNWRRLLFETRRRAKLLRPRTSLVFIGYFLLILPFSDSAAFYSTPLLSKVTIPQFIVDFLFTKWWWGLLSVIVAAVVYLIGIRFLFVLPSMSLKMLSLREALAETRLSKGKKLHFFVKNITLSVAISLITVLPSQLVYYGFYFLQLFFDKFTRPAALPAAIVSMLVIQMINALIGVLTSMLFFSLLTHPIPADEINWTMREFIKRKHRIFRFLGFLFVLLVAALFAFINWYYLSGNMVEKPLTISHRGVNNENGVQNTLPALEKTSRAHPDYVEMDIQETKDHQFVVMHDANLKELTGVNKTPQQLTLSELTALSAHEHGMSAPVVSFDAYLAEANRLQQKLLVEIKTSPRDSGDMLDLFVKKYGQSLLKAHAMVHSLDYKVVAGLKSRESKLPVSFILPYNLIFPQTGANAYTVEATTLDTNFIMDAQFKGKQVFAWTVNDAPTMNKMMYDGASGIITDDLSLLQHEISTYQQHPDYADRLLMYFSILSRSDGSAGN